MDHRRLLLLAACCIGLGACEESLANTGDDAHEIDIARYHRTFSESFDHLDVSPWGPGSKWIAHTPWHGDFGDAEFSDPTPGFPFATASTILRIEARKETDGKWRSGLIASRDHDGLGVPAGFGQLQ